MIRSKPCTFSLPFKRSVVLQVPCKRKADLCKFLSIQKFLRTRVKGINKTSCNIVDHNDTCMCFLHCVYWKPSRKMVTRKKKRERFCLNCSGGVYYLSRAATIIPKRIILNEFTKLNIFSPLCLPLQTAQNSPQ